jgi:hypothetical protein
MNHDFKESFASLNTSSVEFLVIAGASYVAAVPVR